MQTSPSGRPLTLGCRPSILGAVGARWHRRRARGGAASALLVGVALALSAAAPEPGTPDPVPPQDYPIYDRVISQKFLTSQTRLVLIRRDTVSQLLPGAPPADLTFFRDSAFFEGRLGEDLIRDFVLKAARPYRLEGRFNFGLPYRLVSGEEPQGPEVSLAPLPVSPALSPPSTVGVLEFSRVAFGAKGDRALVYVADNRPDGSGAGFLALLDLSDGRWTVVDTEVLWVARSGPPPDE